MGLATIGIGLLLFVVLVVFTLIISPPSAWVKTKGDDTDERR